MKTPEQKAAYAAKVRAKRKLWTEEDHERMRQYQRAWNARNPEKRRANAQRAARKRQVFLAANRDIQKGYRTKYRHGLSLVAYDSKLKSQNNLCGLCSLPFTEDDGPSLDHNHTTKQLRDFCHRTCNLAIGNLKDSSELCRKAAEYLERHSRG